METRRIDFGPLEPASTILLDEGWSYREEGAWDGKATDWTWAAARRVSLRFLRFRRGPITMRLRVRSVPGSRAGPIRPFVNGEALPEIRLREEWSEAEVRIPERLVIVGTNEVAIDLAEIEPVTSRGLQVGFDRIDFLGDLERDAAEPPLPVDVDPRSVPPLSALKYTLRVPEDAKLAIDYRLHPSSGECPPRLAIFTEGTEPTDRIAVTPDASKASRSHREEEVSLRPVGGRVVDLYVANSSCPESGSVLEVRSLRIEAPAKRVRNDARPLNLVVLVLDALRADRLSSSGYPRDTSPEIDRMAAESAVFERAYSQSSFTAASLPSILSGLYVQQHGAHLFARLAEEVETLPEVLSARGYRTIALSANPFFSAEFGMAQGFAEFHPLYETSPVVRRGIDGAVLAEDFIPELAGLLAKSGSEPFFLYLHFMQPHEPYVAPPPFLGYYGEPRGSPAEVAERLKALLKKPGASLSEDERQYVRDRYDENVRYADRQAGRVLGLLRGLGLEENTVLVLTADHGEELFDHGDATHGGHLYDETVHVPLIVRAPGVPARRIATLVQSIDLASTLLDIAGAASSLGAGRSLLPLMRGKSEAAPEGSQAVFASLPSGAAMIRTDRHKLIRDPAGAWELYDLVDDPDERTNVATKDPERLEELAARFDEWWRASIAEELTTEKPQLDEEMLERLRGLGYVLDP